MSEFVRCDKESDPSVQTPEWNALISEQYGELWSIVAQTGLRYFDLRMHHE